MTTPPLEVRVADYPQVKAVLDAAQEVCESEDATPWTLNRAIHHLRRAMARLDD